MYGEGVMFCCLKTFIGEKALGQLSSSKGLWPCGCCLAEGAGADKRLTPRLLNTLHPL